jgi:hypothetical protein
MRAHRIEVDIAHQLQQIRFLLTENGAIASLEDMPRQMVNPVEMLGIAGQAGTHEGGKRHLLGLDEQVEMIGHETIAMKKSSKLANGLIETVQHEEIIIVRQEEGLSAVASIQAVIECPREKYPGFTSHGQSSKTI